MKTEQQKREAWLARHRGWKPVMLDILMRDYRMELVEYEGRVVLLEEDDMAVMDEAIEVAVDRALALPVVAPPEVIREVRVEVPVEVIRYVGQPEGGKGKAGYERRAGGEKWASMPKGWLNYAKAYARKRGLPWPPRKNPD